MAKTNIVRTRKAPLNLLRFTYHTQCSVSNSPCKPFYFKIRKTNQIQLYFNCYRSHTPASTPVLRNAEPRKDKRTAHTISLCYYFTILVPSCSGTENSE